MTEGQGNPAEQKAVAERLLQAWLVCRGTAAEGPWRPWGTAPALHKLTDPSANEADSQRLMRKPQATLCAGCYHRSNTSEGSGLWLGWQLLGAGQFMLKYLLSIYLMGWDWYLMRGLCVCVCVCVFKFNWGLPWWLSGKESGCECRRHRFDP